MRERTLRERLLQISLFRGEGTELFADCKQISMPLFAGNVDAMPDALDEDEVSLLISRAHLCRRSSHETSMVELCLLQRKLTECIREQYQNLILEELRDQHECILREQRAFGIRITASAGEMKTSSRAMQGRCILSSHEASSVLAVVTTRRV